MGRRLDKSPAPAPCSMAKTKIRAGSQPATHRIAPATRTDASDHRLARALDSREAKINSTARPATCEGPMQAAAIVAMATLAPRSWNSIRIKVRRIPWFSQTSAKMAEMPQNAGRRSASCSAPGSGGLRRGASARSMRRRVRTAQALTGTAPRRIRRPKPMSAPWAPKLCAISAPKGKVTVPEKPATKVTRVMARRASSPRRRVRKAKQVS